jgi:hypothetical protein
MEGTTSKVPSANNNFALANQSNSSVLPIISKRSGPTLESCNIIDRKSFGIVTFKHVVFKCCVSNFPVI